MNPINPVNPIDHDTAEPPTSGHPAARPSALAPSGRPLLSVWATGQQPSRMQRRGRYVPEAMAHPAKMLPAIAAQAIEAFTRPGDIVVDPMCGIGTTLVEAVHLGRDAFGVEYEPRWAEVTATNLAHARRNGATGYAEIIRADARVIADLAPVLHGRAALILTSPPYGAITHGHVRTTRNHHRSGVEKLDNRYSADPGNLAHQPQEKLLDAFTRVLAGCHTLLRPGATLAVTARPYRSAGGLIDLPGQVIECAKAAGFEPRYRIAALLCGLGDDVLITRASFFQKLETRRHRNAGSPVHVLAHEDFLVFTKPATPPGADRAAAIEMPDVEVIAA